jgi:CheY-like chemotaxis protein
MSAKKILVADDDRVILRTLSQQLKANSYEPLTARDGSEAVRLARQQKPDLILLDLTFPPDVAHGGGVGWDGFLIMRWLQQMEEAKDVPVIVITGGDPAVCKGPALAAGARAFFHKPIDHDELLRTIRQVLGETPPTEGPQA